jgi:hypothetical protein
LPVSLYGSDTSYIILREERGTLVFENRVLRNLNGPKRNAVIREWKRLHNEQLHGGKRPLGRLKRKWNNNIETDLQ